jgi:hypothetical protein
MATRRLNALLPKERWLPAQTGALIPLSLHRILRVVPA